MSWGQEEGGEGGGGVRGGEGGKFKFDKEPAVEESYDEAAGGGAFAMARAGVGSQAARGPVGSQVARGPAASEAVAGFTSKFGNVVLSHPVSPEPAGVDAVSLREREREKELKAKKGQEGQEGQEEVAGITALSKFGNIQLVGPPALSPPGSPTQHVHPPGSPHLARPTAPAPPLSGGSVRKEDLGVDHDTILEALNKFSDKDAARRLPSASAEVEGEGAGDVGYGSVLLSLYFLSLCFLSLCLPLAETLLACARPSSRSVLHQTACNQP